MKLNVSRLQKQKVLTDHVQIIANINIHRFSK